MKNGVDACDVGTTDEGKIQAVYRRLEKLRQSSPKLTCAEELEALEGEIQSQTGELGRLIIEHHVQQALESAAIKDEEKRLIGAMPGKLKNEGREEVRICTGSGLRIRVRVSYYRRRCDRRKKKRSRGVYAGLILVGIHERCTPLLSSRVSMMSALLSSFQEAKQVLSEQGIELGVKVMRKLAYRYAARARVVQQSAGFCLGNDLPSQGRRIAVSCDGGKTRLRENKSGPKTKKKRTRYNGAWREPKLLII